MNSDYSRALLLASTATGVEGDLRDHLEQQVVTVSCAPDPGCIRAARILLTVLRRLPLVLAFDEAGVPEEDVRAIRAAVIAVDPERPLRASPPGGGTCVHIGFGAAPGVLLVVPSQHGAHIVRDGRLVDALPASPLGSCVAAAMAAAEVFKEVVSVRTERRQDPQHAAFCPVTMSNRPEDAPALPLPFEFSGALVGLGAIGSATAMILGELGTAGDIDLVDRQRFGIENVATYSLGGVEDADAAVWKTQLAERALTRARCRRFDDGVEKYVEGVQAGAIDAPNVVLAGLDSVEARHETQRLWPDLLIDGGTGDTMLGVHVVRDGGRPCMQCFVRPRAAASAYVRLSEFTGLPIAKLRDGDAVLSEEDLAGTTSEQRARLSPHLGRKICGLADAVGLTDIASDGYQPSVAFVALGAACLVVGRLVAETLGFRSPLNFVQYDALVGVDARTMDERNPDPNCYCSERALTIHRVRERRYSKGSNR